jgi:methionyl-tRNA formyltransferase
VLTETVRPRDTAGDLLGRLATAGAGLLATTLDGIEAGTLVPVPQPDEGVSLAPKVTVDEARVDWSRPAHVVDRLIRGCTPAPGAWTTFRGERIKIGPLRGVRTPPAPRPADQQGLTVEGPDVVLFAAGAGYVLGDVQPPGKRMMPAADWARGARIQPGETFA